MSDEHAFTPGPWEIDPDCGEVYSPTIYRSICQVLRAENWQANARLIATAPELYEAVREALSHIGDGGYIPSIGKPATDRLRAALVKAEGCR